MGMQKYYINIPSNVTTIFFFFFLLLLSISFPNLLSSSFIIFLILLVGFVSLFFLILQVIQHNFSFFIGKSVTRIKFVIDSALSDCTTEFYLSSLRHQARRLRFWHRRQRKSMIRRSPMCRQEPWNSMVSSINGRSHDLWCRPIFSVVWFHGSFELVVFTRRIAWSPHTRNCEDSILK